MKKGDKVICKQNYGHFKKGHRYTVTQIHSIFSDKDYATVQLSGINQYRFKLTQETFGYIEDYIDSSLDPYLYDHFYGEKEMRKLKLDEINEIN